MADTDWLNAFLKRNSSLSIRRPEATSFARAMNWNRANANAIFLRICLRFSMKINFEPHNVYNAGASLLTVRVAVNATWDCVHPCLCYQEKNFRDYFFFRWTNRLYTSRKWIWLDARRRKYSGKIIVHQMKLKNKVRVIVTFKFPVQEIQGTLKLKNWQTVETAVKWIVWGGLVMFMRSNSMQTVFYIFTNHRKTNNKHITTIISHLSRTSRNRTDLCREVKETTKQVTQEWVDGQQTKYRRFQQKLLRTGRSHSTEWLRLVCLDN
jgi:hypothetical protein